jgi:AcrR family transcriptional regulator
VPRSYHHGNLREALIQEGVKLIEETGVNSLTLREIGVRAGVSRTAAYRHFADKSQLLAAISETAFTEFGDALEAARTRTAGDSLERLHAMGQAYLKFAAEHRAYYEVMFGMNCDLGDQTVASSAAGARAFAILEVTIREGQAAGEIREGDAAEIATIVWALTHGIATLRPAIGADHDYMTAVSALLRNGLRPAAQRAA